MARGEVEEGLTWGELFQVVTEKAGGRELERNLHSIVEDENPRQQDEKKLWPILFLLLFKERSFFGLSKDRGGKISIMRIKSAKRVLDIFFERAWSEPIVRSQTG
jgi:hypothetical protein